MKAVDEVFATMRHKRCKIRQEVNWSLRLGVSGDWMKERNLELKQSSGLESLKMLLAILNISL